MLVTVKEAAELLKVNRNTVYNLINSGELPSVELGSKKIRKSTLEAYIERLEK